MGCYKYDVDDEVQDDTIPLEPFMYKKELIVSRILHIFWVQLEKIISKLLDVTRKVRDEFN